MSTKNAYYPFVVGVILILVGLFLQVPGTALTTSASRDGETVSEAMSEYFLDDKYSAIDEYVNGDAYNYIIGAALVGSKINAMIIAKTICLVAGALCICAGFTISVISKNNAAMHEQLMKALAESTPSVAEKTELQDIEENLPQL